MKWENDSGGSIPGGFCSDFPVPFCNRWFCKYGTGESVNLTAGGPGFSTMAMAHHIYNTSFVSVPNFGYSCAMSMLILVVVAAMTLDETVQNELVSESV